MTSEQSDEASKKNGDPEREFESWWAKLLKREPSYYSEYVKIKKLCREAFVAGRSMLDLIQ